MESKKPAKITASTQAYLDIEEIKEDVVLLKDDSLRAVVVVSSLNFALKSEEERDSIVSSFQNFLNSLNFPIQIVVDSKKTDLDEYINLLKDLEGKQTNELLKLQTSEYIIFIQGLLEQVNIMDKSFYIIVSYFPNAITSNSVFSKFTGGKKETNTNFENDKLKLMDKVDYVVNGLSSIGLNCISLDTQNLIQLYYSIFNPESYRRQKIQDASDITASVIEKKEEK